MIRILAEVAQSQIGVREVGQNGGAEIREYQLATTLKPGPWPYCAAFVDWCIREWLERKNCAPWLSLQTMTPETWRPKTALAFGLIDWAKSRPNTTHILGEKAEVEAGDIVIFDFSHCGIVVRGFDGFIETVEGNTNNAGNREGDGVYRKIRPQKLARAFIRIRQSELAGTRR